jgi:hypothetical protein
VRLVLILADRLRVYEGLKFLAEFEFSATPSIEQIEEVRTQKYD